MEMTIQAMQQQAAVMQQSGGAVSSPEGNVFETMVREMMGGEMQSLTAIPAQAALSRKAQEPGLEQQSLMAALTAQAQPVFTENEVQIAEQIQLPTQEAIPAAEMQQTAAEAAQNTQGPAMQASASQARSVHEETAQAQSTGPEGTEQAAKETQATAQAIPQAPRQEQTAENHDAPMQFTEVDVRQEERRVAKEAPLFTIPLEAAPVKVGEAVVELESPKAPQAMAEQILKAAEQADGETPSVLTIQVEPAELGPVKVTFSKNGSGTLQIAIEAANSKAAALLEKHNPQLQALLSGSLKGEVQVVVQKNEAPWLQQHDGWNGSQQGGQHRQQQERQQESKEAMDDFLQRLRLGLVSIEGIAS